MKHGDNHVISCNAVVIWDGITKPETTKNGQPLPKPQYSLKLALQPNAPCITEIDAICKAALQTSEFKGVMPHGGSWPLAAANPQIADGALNGMVTINPKTSQQDITQKVYDANGQILNPLTYSRMFYPGAVVQVIVHAYPFNNVQKGIALGLDGIRIIDAQAPALNIGAAMPASEVGNIFAGAPVQGAAVGQAPVYGAPGMPPVQGAQQLVGTIGYQSSGIAGQYAPPPVFTPPAGPMPPIIPAPDFLNPAGGMPAAPPPPPVHQMTPAANGATYEQMIGLGWTDVTLRQHGMMV